MTSLLIGNGRRAINTLLPALKASKGEVFLFGRNKSKVKELCSIYNLNYLDDLRNSPGDISRVFVAIPNEAIKPIIANLPNRIAQNAELYLDTPIFGPIINFRLFKLKKNFKKIFVTEDWLSKPFFVFSKTLGKKYGFGKIKKIIFDRSGFSYHSLAVSRYIFDEPLLSISQSKSNEQEKLIFTFKTCTMELINPKDYDSCNIRLEFENGLIDYAENYTHQEEASEKDSIFIYRVLKNGSIKYCFDYPKKGVKKETLKSKNFSLPHKLHSHYENEEKILSLISKLNCFNENYSLEEGVYDSLAIAIFHKLNFFKDLSLGSKSLLQLFINIYGKIQKI